MLVVNFEDTLWKDIPEQDNPAMNKSKNDEGLSVSEECLIICKAVKGAHRITNNGIVVIYNPPRGDVTSLGVFWRSELALAFALMCASSPEFHKTALEMQSDS